jgi:hypothetical protein
MDHWEGFKKKEGKTRVLDGIPVMLPALMRAEKLQYKAAQVGFDWPEIGGAVEKFKATTCRSRKLSFSAPRISIFISTEPYPQVFHNLWTNLLLFIRETLCNSCRRTLFFILFSVVVSWRWPFPPLGQAFDPAG